MKLYIIYNKYNMRSLFFNEKIIAPVYYNDTFYSYKIKEEDSIENSITLYSKVPKSLIADDSFIIELEMKLIQNNYINNEIIYIIFNNIYLDNSEVILKNIYYCSEHVYRDLITEIMLIGEAKLYDNYKEKFNMLDKGKVDIISDDEFKKRRYKKIKTAELVELEMKKGIEYDCLKGSLYLVTKFYPQILIRSKRENKLSKKILHIRNFIKKLDDNVNDLPYEKSQIKKLLSKSIDSYRNQISINISKHTKDKKQSIFTISDKNQIRMNFGINASKMKKSDYILIDKIINVIVSAKLNKYGETEKNIKEVIASEVGHYCKEVGDSQLYYDARTLYSVLINRNLSSNYKDIKNDVIKFLYLSLEYYDNINTLNSIVNDYRFANYYIIYAFTGLIVGFEKLNKIYTDNQKLDIFNVEFKLQLREVIKRLDQLYNTCNFYRKSNYEIIRKITEESEYYKFIKRYSFYKREVDNIKMMRKSKDVLVIYIDNKYKLYLNKKITKQYLLNKKRLSIKQKKNSDTVFNSFNYTKIDGKKLEYYDEIKLNTILKDILNNIELNN